MDQVNTMPQPQNKPSKNWLIIIIVILIFLAIISFLIWRQSQKAESNPTQGDYVQNQMENKRPPKEIPEEFFSHVGKIIKIQDDRLAIKALAEKNNLEKDELVTIIIGGNTRIIKRTIPKVSEETNSDGSITEVITKDELLLGQEIVAISSQNIKNQNLFTASQIELIVIE